MASRNATPKVRTPKTGSSSRPGSTLDRLTATGGAPPTASRLKTGSGTPGSRRPTGTGASTDMKAALMDTLVNKLREKFSVTDMKSQDIIGQEVVSYLAANASMKPEDLGHLEERIRQKLAPSASNPGNARQKALMLKKLNDEWAKLAKFEQEQAVIEEYRRKELEKVRVANLREVLEVQVREQEEKVLIEKEMEMAYAAEEQKTLEQWHAEEQKKVEHQKAIRERLNQERAAQIADKEMRKAKALARQKQEEKEAMEMLQQEHRRIKQLEAEKRERQKQINEQFKKDNAVQLVIMQEQKEKDMAEDIAYQKLAIETLDKREVVRNKMLEDFKIMQQKRLEIAGKGGQGVELKKWMDEDIINRNFQEREALLDLQEDEAKRKILEKNMEQRRVLAAQLREKEARKQMMIQAEAERNASFVRELTVANKEEVSRKQAQDSTRHLIRLDLEAQMREKALRDDNPIMTEVERTLNKQLLARVQMQSMPPKSGSGFSRGGSSDGSRGSHK